MTLEITFFVILWVLLEVPLSLHGLDIAFLGEMENICGYKLSVPLTVFWHQSLHASLPRVLLWHPLPGQGPRSSLMILNQWNIITPNSTSLHCIPTTRMVSWRPFPILSSIMVLCPICSTTSYRPIRLYPSERWTNNIRPGRYRSWGIVSISPYEREQTADCFYPPYAHTHWRCSPRSRHRPCPILFAALDWEDMGAMDNVWRWRLLDQSGTRQQEFLSDRVGGTANSFGCSYRWGRNLLPRQDNRRRQQPGRLYCRMYLQSQWRSSPPFPCGERHIRKQQVLSLSCMATDLRAREVEKAGNDIEYCKY